MELELVASEADVSLLCAWHAPLAIWASGVGIVTRRTKMLIPEELALYHIGMAAPLPSPGLGYLLAHNAQELALAAAWAEAALPGSRVLHPLARLTEPLEPRAAAGQLFASHIEASVLSNTSRSFPSSGTRLGTSGAVYDHCLGACSWGAARIDGPVTARGCVISGAPSVLLHTALGICSAGGSCLVVAPREALGALLDVLAPLQPTVASSARELEHLEQPAQLTKLMVCTPELARRTNRIWDRAVIVDWASVAPRLRGSQLTLVPCQLQVALCVGRPVPCELALLLGVPQRALGALSTIRELVLERTLVLETERAEPSVVCYERIEFEGPLAEEQAESAGLEGFQRCKQRMLGSLMESRSLRVVQGQLANHFGVNVTSFARRSFDKPQGCAICLADEPGTAVARCGHWFCGSCIDRSLRVAHSCPVCRTRLRGRDVAHVSLECSSYVRQLIELMRQDRCLVVCSFGSALERLAKLLRALGKDAYAWSGNSTQLQTALRNVKTGASLLHDPQHLSLRWLQELPVERILVLLPLDSETTEACCQLRDVLPLAPSAQLQMVGWQNQGWIAMACHKCPFLACAPR